MYIGQEEYFEHKSEVTQCKFSSEGYNIASCDVDGVVKVWSASPGPPNTYATFVSQVGVSALVNPSYFIKLLKSGYFCFNFF